MALQLKKLEPVQFGDFSATPKMYAERLLRVSQAKFGTLESHNEALDIMSECFDENQKKVRDFLSSLPLLELYRLQAYLVGGDEALESLNEQVLSKTKELMEDEAK